MGVVGKFSPVKIKMSVCYSTFGLVFKGVLNIYIYIFLFLKKLQVEKSNKVQTSMSKLSQHPYQ